MLSRFRLELTSLFPYSGDELWGCCAFTSVQAPGNGRKEIDFVRKIAVQV